MQRRRRGGPAARLTIASCLLAGLSAASVASCRRQPAAAKHAQLPSDAIGRAQALGAAGDAALGLIYLTEAVCARASGQSIRPPNVSEATATRTDVQLVNAWVSLWDLAGRHQGAQRAVAACYGSAPVSLLLAVAIADATGDWTRAAGLAEQRPPGAPAALQAELGMRHAIALLHLGREQAAIAELERSIDQAPEHAGLRVALAQARFAAGDYATVVHTLWPLLEQPEAPQQPLLARAHALLQAARQAAAPAMTPADLAEHADLMRLANAEEVGPDDVAHAHDVAAGTLQPQLYTWCALILLKQGEQHQGRKLLERARKQLPLDPMPARLLAAHLLTVDDYDGALLMLLEAARRDPFDVETQQLLAKTASRVGAWPLAEAAFAALVRLTPGDDAAHAGLAQTNKAMNAL